jgi:hypothetical protein
MKPEDVRRHYRTSYNFRKETGMSTASWFNWTDSGFVPIASQFKLEEMTKGELKASWEDARKK